MATVLDQVSGTEKNRAATRLPGLLPLHWLLLLPTLALMALLLLYPLAYQFYLSVHDATLDRPVGTFVGVANFVELFNEPDFWLITRNSFVWTLGSLLFQFLLGMGVALLLNQGYPGSGIYRAFMLAPWVMPGVVIGIIWRWIYNPINGILNAALDLVGIAPVYWLDDPTMAMAGVIIANVWKGFPFWMLMISAGLQMIPNELYEAAKVDGSSAFQRFRFVTLPGLKTILVMTSTLGFIWTFNFFDLIYVLTGGGPAEGTRTFPLYIYRTAFKYWDFSESAATAVLLALLMGIGMVVYIRAVRLREEQVQ